MKHKHHIIPRYEGGSNLKENLIELTPTQHSMWHYAEWLRKGNQQDYIAWKALSGRIGKGEILHLKSVLGGKSAYQGPETQEKKRKAMTGRKQTELHKKRRSDALKGRVCCSPEAIERMRQTKRSLTDEQVKEILTSTEKGVTLSNKYGVGAPLISAIRHRKAPGYKHLY